MKAPGYLSVFLSVQIKALTMAATGNAARAMPTPSCPAIHSKPPITNGGADSFIKILINVFAIVVKGA